VTSQNRIPLVQNGTVDIECGSTTNNATRQKDVAFAVTTYVEEVRIAVKANSGITSVAQLNGKTVATTTGTTSVQLLRKHERAAGVDFKEVFGKDHADSFLLLESGRADAFVMDGSDPGRQHRHRQEPGRLQDRRRVLSVEPIAIMIRKDDPPSRSLADDTLKGMMKSGEMAKLWTSGSCSRSRRRTPRSACPERQPPRPPGPTRTTSHGRVREEVIPARSKATNPVRRLAPGGVCA
jgi:glutamate/aspartate transport system substrate-binding protein